MGLCVNTLSKNQRKPQNRTSGKLMCTPRAFFFYIPPLYGLQSRNLNTSDTSGAMRDGDDTECVTIGTKRVYYVY
jgi:hypothetical protein